MSYRTRKVSSGDVEVLDDAGRPVATGFDDLSEAEEWIANRRREDALLNRGSLDKG